MNKDEALDSITHHQERAAKMRAEAETTVQVALKAEDQRKQQQVDRDRATRHAQADELEARIGLIRENESREMLLDRIRKMREDVPPSEPVNAYQRSPGLQAQYELEQKNGREAVARAEAQEASTREARMKAEEEERSKQALTVPVHHPNPGNDEQFPAIKATLGKTKR